MAKAKSRSATKGGGSKKKFVNLIDGREELPKFKIPAWVGRKELRLLLQTEQSDDEAETESPTLEEAKDAEPQESI